MTLEQIFVPLNERLCEYELRNEMHPSPYSIADYPPLMKDLFLNVANFPTEKTSALIKRYTQRTKLLLKEVMDETSDEIKNITFDFTKIEVIEVDIPVTSNYIWEVDMLNELKFYDAQLSVLYKNWEIKDSQKSEIKPIQLPPNTTIKLNQKDFASELSPSQTELFLYLLKENRIIGGYTATDLGIIAGMLFGKSPQETRAHITKIHPGASKSRIDLEKLKGLTEKLLEDIENELLKAR